MSSAIDIIMKRCSQRSYKDTPVRNEDIEKILRAAMAAPTAVNKQPWEFVVVNDRQILDSLAKGMIYGKSLKQAPLAIVVCANTKKTVPIYKDFWIQDCSAATQNILLSCTDLGLGSLWLGVHPVDMFKNHVSKTLNLPKHIIPLNIVVIGYAEKPSQVMDKYKPEQIKYNKYE